MKQCVIGVIHVIGVIKVFLDSGANLRHYIIIKYILLYIVSFFAFANA